MATGTATIAIVTQSAQEFDNLAGASTANNGFTLVNNFTQSVLLISRISPLGRVNSVVIDTASACINFGQVQFDTAQLGTISANQTYTLIAAGLTITLILFPELIIPGGILVGLAQTAAFGSAITDPSFIALANWSTNQVKKFWNHRLDNPTPLTFSNIATWNQGNEFTNLMRPGQLHVNKGVVTITVIPGDNPPNGPVVSGGGGGGGGGEGGHMGTGGQDGFGGWGDTGSGGRKGSVIIIEM